jgi:hypothetical protein
VRKLIAILPFLLFLGLCLTAQDLEPRALTTIPLKTNFFGAGYAYSTGNLLLDPAIPIEDLSSIVNSGLLAYVRGFGLFGNSSKISVFLPYADAYFEGVAFGRDSTRSVAGFGDPIIVLSTNFIGSPALAVAEYRSFKQRTVIGINLKMRVPLGQYDAERTLNIGSNRFQFRPEIGVSTRKDSWIFETYFALWLFTQNDLFWAADKNITMQQKPLLVLKQHVIYALKNQMWLAFNAGYGIGGSTINDGREMNNRISTIRLGGTFVIPFARRHALKFNYNNSIALERGPDFQSFNVVYQYRWINN